MTVSYYKSNNIKHIAEEQLNAIKIQILSQQTRYVFLKLHTAHMANYLRTWLISAITKFIL